MKYDQLTSRQLYEYCMEEYNNINPFVKCLINNFYKNIGETINQHIRDGDTLFEVGCGAGESSERILKMIKSSNRLTVSDYDLRFVQMINMHRPHLNVIQADAYHLNELREQYDWVIALEVLEHLDNYENALKEIFQLSRKYVLISVPNEPWWKILNMLRFKYLTDYGNTPGHINHWSLNQLSKTLTNHGTLISIKRPVPWIVVLLSK